VLYDNDVHDINDVCIREKVVLVVNVVKGGNFMGQYLKIAYDALNEGQTGVDDSKNPTGNHADPNFSIFGAICDWLVVEKNQDRSLGINDFVKEIKSNMGTSTPTDCGDRKTILKMILFFRDALEGDLSIKINTEKSRQIVIKSKFGHSKNPIKWAVGSSKSREHQWREYQAQSSQTKNTESRREYLN